jgi:preprotein translocase subunit SecA
LADELVVLARLPNFRLTNEQMRWITSSPDQLKDSVNAQIEVYILNLNATRMVGALERRLGESLNLKPGQLNGKDWPEISDLLSSEAEALLARQFERLLGPSGQIARELDTALEKYDEYVTEPNQLLDLLGMMSTGTRMVFDRKTHRQGFQQTSRLRWVYLAAQLLGEANPQAVTADVLEHLEGAQEALRDIFGAVDAQILQQTRVSLGQTDPRLRPYLVDALGEEVFEQAANLPFEELDPGAREIVESVLGWWRQNEIYRSLVLNAISDLWVDYLTRVEALRVSIGLEAYAQRDPLVQYKSKASEMFTDLLAEIRAAVISRIFNMRPRQAGSAPASGSGAPASLSAPAAPALPGPGNGSAAQPGAPSAAGSAKKKRRRH